MTALTSRPLLRLLVVLLALAAAAVFWVRPDAAPAVAPPVTANANVTAATEPERVATLNMRNDISDDRSEDGLRKVLAYSEIVGLQEWRVSRNNVLDRVGTIRSEASLAADTPSNGWVFVRADGADAEPVGFDGERYRLLRARSVLLHPESKVEVRKGYKTIQRARHAAVVVLAERSTGRQISVINFHLDAHVQNGKGGYRAGQPKANARHKAQVDRLREVAANQLSLGHTVYAVGDTNFHGLQIPGLRSIWNDHGRLGGTHEGGRQIDVIYSTRGAAKARKFATASDHNHPVGMYMIPADN